MEIIKKTETARGMLTYTLFAENIADRVAYGISVKSELFGEAEVSEIRDITSELDFAEKLICTLADNLVLPSTLAEVTEEFLSAEYTI